MHLEQQQEESHMQRFMEEADRLELAVANAPRLRVIHGTPAETVLDESLARVAPGADLLTLDDATLVQLAETYLDMEQGTLGKVTVYRPEGGRGNVVIGPVARLGRVLQGEPGSVEKLRGLVEMQCANGNWDYSPYHFGLANGLILALSVLTGEEPQFLTAPKEWIEDKASAITETPTSGGEVVDNAEAA